MCKIVARFATIRSSKNWCKMYCHRLAQDRYSNMVDTLRDCRTPHQSRFSEQQARHVWQVSMWYYLHLTCAKVQTTKVCRCWYLLSFAQWSTFTSQKVMFARWLKDKTTGLILCLTANNRTYRWNLPIQWQPCCFTCATSRPIILSTKTKAVKQD